MDAFGFQKMLVDADMVGMQALLRSRTIGRYEGKITDKASTCDLKLSREYIDDVLPSTRRRHVALDPTAKTNKRLLKEVKNAAYAKSSDKGIRAIIEDILSDSRIFTADALVVSHTT